MVSIKMSVCQALNAKQSDKQEMIVRVVQERRFKSESPTVPLKFASISGEKKFGTGSGFGGDRQTFGCADGDFSTG
jgi:hypothetical protein